MSRILHIIPENAVISKSQGSCKDIDGRVGIFESSGNNYHRLVLKRDDVSVLDAAVKEIVPTHVLIEYTYLARLAVFIRRRFPDIFIAVRAHNIEPMQHFDNHGWDTSSGRLWLLYGMLRLLLKDIASKKVADVIYAISDWEEEHYWRYLPGHARVTWLPYFTPARLIPTAPEHERTVIACLPTSHENRKSIDLVERFTEFVGAAKKTEKGRSYRYVVTGDLENWNYRVSRNVDFTGRLDDLNSFMRSVNAVAVLSPLGYGFKTTIADALATGCKVILHPILYKRCGKYIDNRCLRYDGSDMGRLFDSLMEFADVEKGVRYMDRLKSIAHTVLQKDFLE